MLRRVKSFSVKKYKSSDELKPPAPTSPQLRPRRKQLQKEKSISLECVPIRLDLEKNELFRKQKEKAKQQEIEEKSHKKLTRRKSVSCDEQRFVKFREKSPVALRRTQFTRNRSRYNTVDVLNVSKNTKIKTFVKNCI